MEMINHIFMTETYRKIETIINKIELSKNDFNILSWHNFNIDFSHPLERKNEIIKILKENLKDTLGFYAIYDDKECLYIGIGRPIWSRIKSHYYASHENDRAVKWVNFFKENQKQLQIYWKEYCVSDNIKIDDKVRQLLESILTETFNPKFERK